MSKQKTAGEEVVLIKRETPITEIELFEMHYLYEESSWHKLLWVHFPLCKHSDGTYSGMTFTVPLTNAEWSESRDASHPRVPFGEVEPFYELDEKDLLGMLNDRSGVTALERPPLVFIIKFGSFVNLAKKALKLYGYFPGAIAKLEAKLERTKEVWAAMETFRAREEES